MHNFINTFHETRQLVSQYTPVYPSFFSAAKRMLALHRLWGRLGGV